MVETVEPVSKSVFVLIPFTVIFASVGSPQIPGGSLLCVETGLGSLFLLPTADPLT